MSDWRSRAKPVSSNWRERAKPVQSDIPVEDVSSDAVGFGDRFIAKNLAQSVTKQAEYLKQQYPDLDIKVQGNNVLIKRPEDPSYKVLDSSSFELADVADMADVVGAGVASTLGGMGGAAVGALGGGVGAVPGAIGGSALAGSAYEAARQGLGKLAGIPQDISTSDVVTAGAANALGSTLLGTGLKGAGSYQGAIRQAWNKGVPKFAESLYGVPTNVINKYVDEREVVEQAIPRKTEIAQGMVDKIRSALNKEKKAVGSAIGEALDGTDNMVNISEIRNDYMKMIGDLRQEYMRTPNAVTKEKLDAAQATFDQLFKNQRVNENVWKQVVDKGNLSGVKTDVKTNLKRTYSPVGAALDGVDPANPNLPIVPGRQPLNMDDAIQMQYKDELLKNVNRTILRDSPKSSVKNMSRLDAFPGMNQEIPMRMSAPDAFRLQGDLKDFGDLRRIGTGLNPRYGSQATQAEKELSDVALSGYQKINSELDRVTEGLTPELKGQYRDLMQMQSALSSGTATPQQAYSTFTNLPGKSKTAFREQLEKLANKTGQNFDDDITTLQAAEYFGDASWRPKSVGGSTSTTGTIQGSLIGAGLGSTAATMMGVSPFLGGAIGGAAGNVIASPMMLKGVINNTGALRSGANALGRAYNPVVIPVREAIVQSPWDGM